MKQLLTLARLGVVILVWVLALPSAQAAATAGSNAWCQDNFDCMIHCDLNVCFPTPAVAYKCCTYFWEEDNYCICLCRSEEEMQSCW